MPSRDPPLEDRTTWVLTPHVNLRIHSPREYQIMVAFLNGWRFPYHQCRYSAFRIRPMVISHRNCSTSYRMKGIRGPTSHHLKQMVVLNHFHNMAGTDLCFCFTDFKSDDNRCLHSPQNVPPVIHFGGLCGSRTRIIATLTVACHLLRTRRSSCSAPF